MPRFVLIVNEYDPGRPWVFVGQRARELDGSDEGAVLAAARAAWPEPRYMVARDSVRRLEG